MVGRQGSGNHTYRRLVVVGRPEELDGQRRTAASTGSFAAAAVSVGNGFVAVGSEMNCHTIWTSPDGKHWTAHDLAKPDGAQSATLRSVAAGAAATSSRPASPPSGSDLPIVVASADGGAHLTQVVLSSPGRPGHGHRGDRHQRRLRRRRPGRPGSAQHAVTWTSKDGLTWSAATPLSAAGSSEITALTDTTPSPTAPSSPEAAGHRHRSDRRVPHPAHGPRTVKAASPDPKRPPGQRRLSL